jgi:hypothetical protein
MFDEKSQRLAYYQVNFTIIRLKIKLNVIFPDWTLRITISAPGCQNGVEFSNLGLKG